METWNDFKEKKNETYQQIVKLRKVVPRESTTTTVYQLAQEAFVHPENGDIFFNIHPKSMERRGEKLIKIIFYKVKPGNPPTIDRGTGAQIYCPERYLLPDLNEPEITLVNPVTEYN